ncbi:MAG TPA: MBL fold metallo-hydrolase [Fimbriimonadaceae bacterium]|mgnify:CR=1 FL=1|nr:MBL fold metallo-hydrolase [Fimbriimonadaceae bacterium]
MRRWVVLGWLVSWVGIAEAKTQIVMLGTGSPVADYARSGPATAIVVDGTAYLVDAGANCVRQADAAYREKGIAALKPVKIERLFLTHLHTDHTLGYPDLIFTPWDMGRMGPLRVYGPVGTKAMTQNLIRAWKIDIKVRTSGLEGSAAGVYQPLVREIEPGVVYRDGKVSVTAFRVLHGSFPNSYGFQFKTKDGKTIVVSGDTKPCSEVVRYARGADALVHEVYSNGHYAQSTPEFRKYLLAFHTASWQLADIANKARPKLLILTHKLGYLGENVGEIGVEVARFYEGRIVDANDLDVIELD